MSRDRWMLAGVGALMVLALAMLWTARDMILSPAAPPTTIVARGSDNDTVLSPKAIAARAMPATVEIRALDVLGAQRGGGTGFFISNAGLIATSLHVVNGAHSVQIRTLYGKAYDSVQFVAADGRRDLAILKVHVADAPPASLHALPLASGPDPDVGEAVFVMGNPLGQTGTFSDGLVSARRTALGVTFIQITAPVSPGSSGGPVLNDRGRVLGVTTLRVPRAQNLNYAVPVRYLQRLLDSAGAPVAYGRVLLPPLRRPALLIDDPLSQTGYSGSDETRLDVITRQFRKSDSLLSTAGGTAIGESIRGSLARRDSTSRAIALIRGREYVVAGYCDERCPTFSLAIRSPRGRLVDSDVDVDDVPKLRFTADYTGSHSLSIIMTDCEAKTCKFGVRYYLMTPRRSRGEATLP